MDRYDIYGNRLRDDQHDMLAHFTRYHDALAAVAEARRDGFDVARRAFERFNQDVINALGKMRASLILAALAERWNSSGTTFTPAKIEVKDAPAPPAPSRVKAARTAFYEAALERHRLTAIEAPENDYIAACCREDDAYDALLAAEAEAANEGRMP